MAGKQNVFDSLIDAGDRGGATDVWIIGEHDPVTGFASEQYRVDDDLWLCLRDAHDPASIHLIPQRTIRRVRSSIRFDESKALPASASAELRRERSKQSRKK